MDFERFINLTLILLADNTAKGVAEEELSPLAFEQREIIYFQLKRTEIEQKGVIRNEYNYALRTIKNMQLNRITKQREELAILLEKDIKQVQQKIGMLKDQ